MGRHSFVGENHSFIRHAAVAEWGAAAHSTDGGTAAERSDERGKPTIPPCILERMKLKKNDPKGRGAGRVPDPTYLETHFRLDIYNKTLDRCNLQSTPERE
jgi:hypothetical protein